MPNNYHTNNNKSTEEHPEKEVFRIDVSEIKKRAVSQCQKHVWRKLDDTNLECVNCPTAIQVHNADEFLKL